MSELTCPKCGCPLEEGESCPRCMLQVAAEPTGAFDADPNGTSSVPLTQSPESGETAWQALSKVPLWIVLLLCFGAYFVIPSVFSLTIYIAGIVDVFYGRSSVSVVANSPNFRCSLLTILVLVTAVAIMRHWRLNTPDQWHDKLIRIIIAVLGIAVPYFASGIGTAIYGTKPWFYGFYFMDTVAVMSAMVMYQVSGRFGDRLRYVPVICGYVGWAYLYVSISQYASGPLEVLNIPIDSLYFFIGGYWMAWIIHATHRNTPSTRAKFGKSSTAKR